MKDTLGPAISSTVERLSSQNILVGNLGTLALERLPSSLRDLYLRFHWI